jgi:Sulfotransferase family
MGVLVLNLDQSIAFADPHSLPANSNGAASAAHPTSGPSSIGLAESAILVLGMPRSGTTWLAKILDSHPDVLYRHEPDEVVLANSDQTGVEKLCIWLETRAISTVKPPLMPKAWLPRPLGILHHAAVRVEKVAARVLGKNMASKLKVPRALDLNRRPTRVILKLVAYDAADIAQALPDTRILFLLRHPCGQVQSIVEGVSGGYFEGISPDVGELARSWLIFNERAVAALEGLPNANIVVYEELSATPMSLSRALYEFCGLPWNTQTERFIARTTRQDWRSDYYGVFRNAKAAANRWRVTMNPTAQHAVRDAVRGSPLTRYWPDLNQNASQSHHKE